MGTFRLMLAATVMLGHFVPFYPHHLPYLMTADASVPAFYIVSGFLITLVLREKYRDRSGLFYSNRALRIFPLYWAALILFVVVNWAVVGGPPLERMPTYHYTSALWWAEQYGREVGLFGAVMLVFSNVFIFGQDLMLFIGKWPYLTAPDYFYHFFMFVGPAWTIGVELWFYAVAPFLVRGRAIWVIAVLVLSLAARIFAILSGRTEFIIDYSFPPFELAFFMAGSLAYRAYARLRISRARWITYYGVASCVSILLLTVFYLKLPLARPLYLVAVSFFLPGIVLIGRRNPLDGWCGELSYPIYLLHPIFTIFIVPGATRLSELVAVGGTLAMSFGLILLIERPIEKLRRRRASIQAPAGYPAALLPPPEVVR
jgi:peptidoglycan/LPS O-acetylase OafA/YrhL